MCQREQDKESSLQSLCCSRGDQDSASKQLGPCPSRGVALSRGEASEGFLKQVLSEYGRVCHTIAWDGGEGR